MTDHLAHTYRYSPEELTPFINWIYFFYAWQLPTRYASVAALHLCDACRRSWIGQFPTKEQAQAREALHLYEDALSLLGVMGSSYYVQARLALQEAWSDGDDLVFFPAEHPNKAVRLPLLRQQHPATEGAPNLCLADFVRPKILGVKDCVGVFATAVDPLMEQLETHDDYRHLLAQTLCDRLAEAAAEKLHAEVRTHLWGYAPDERLTPTEMFQCRYRGIRPAVGYPSLPDQSVNFILDELIDFSAIRLNLTSSGAMLPHGSVSGLMLAHPQARYFELGLIGEDQLTDYAQRRHLPESELRKFLSGRIHTESSTTP